MRKMRAREKNQQRRSRGEEFTTSKGKKICALKQPSTKLTCKCKLKCSTLSHRHRSMLFNQYRSIDKNAQRAYLANLIDIIPVRRATTSQSSRREVTSIYRLHNEDGQLVSVCKSTLQDTLGLSRGKLDVLREKSKLGVDSTKDGRGGRRNVKYTITERKLIINFIKSLPRDVRHYDRQDSDKEYLSCGLNYRKLRDEFSRQNPTEVPVTVDFIIRIFKSEFPNLNFHKSRGDICSTCGNLAAKLNGSIAGSKNELLIKKDIAADHSEAGLTKSEITIDGLSLNKNLTCFSIDFQEVMLMPLLSNYCKTIFINKEVD